MNQAPSPFHLACQDAKRLPARKPTPFLMKKFRLSHYIPVAVLLALLLVGLTRDLRAQVPTLLNYQGRVSVAGVIFDSVDGSGGFGFALVSGDGKAVYWS